MSADEPREGWELQAPAGARPLARPSPARMEEIQKKVAECRLLDVRPTSVYREYDPEVEEKEYCRSLLAPEDLARLKEMVEEQGFLSPDDVREILDQNSTQKFTPDGIFIIDADLVLQIDTRTNYPVFILPDNSVFSREGLLRAYPFELFQTEPEEIFAQQEVGVFPAPRSYLSKNAKSYLVRDYGSDDDFLMIEDLVGRAARKNYVDRRPPERVVLSKVFLAREGWDDFVAVVNQTRAMRRILGNALRKSRADGEAGFLPLLYGSAGGGAPVGLLSLEDAEGREERLRKEKEDIERREAELARREREIDERIANLERALNENL